MADDRQLPMITFNFTDYNNFTEDQYLENILGPKHLPLKLVLPVTVIYVLIFVTGVFGNAVTCAVIIRNPAMQTTTNHYLFNLAVSDLMLLVLGLPNELWVFWQQYPWEFGLTVCKGRAFVSEMSSYVSVLTIVAFSLERYLAICHPLRLYVMSGLKRHMFIILSAWIVALISAVPFCWYTEVNYVEWPPNSRNVSRNSAVCAMLNMPHFPLYEISCVIFFLGPMAVIMWLYVHMGLAIQSTTLGRRIDGTVHGETRPSQSRKAIIRMLSAVVITFFVCWAPFHVQRLLWVHTEKNTFATLNEWLYPLTGSLYYFSTAINPILYNVMSAKYRRAFKQTLRCSTTINQHFHTDADMSSMRDAGFCRCGSLRISQIVRMHSLSKKRTAKSAALTKQSPIQVRCQPEYVRNKLPSSPPDDENESRNLHHPYCSRNGNRNITSSCHDPINSIEKTNPTIYGYKKCSIVIQARNGRTKCHRDEQREKETFGEIQI